MLIWNLVNVQMLFICSTSAYHLFQCHKGGNAVKKKKSASWNSLTRWKLSVHQANPSALLEALLLCFLLQSALCAGDRHKNPLEHPSSISCNFQVAALFLQTRCQFSLPGCGTLLRGPGSCRQNTVWLPAMHMLPRTPKSYMLPVKTILIREDNFSNGSVAAKRCPSAPYPCLTRMQAKSLPTENLTGGANRRSSWKQWTLLWRKQPQTR